MSISYEQIIEACRPMLESIDLHSAKTRQERPFITAYQVWDELKEEDHPICPELINECGGDFVYKDTGSYVGPAQKIAQALGNCPDIETQYLYTKGLMFNNGKPSGSDCGIFRISS